MGYSWSDTEVKAMFQAKTKPAIFQQTPTGASMNLHVPAAGYGYQVAIVRTLRDGSTTREYLPEYLAELVVAMIPFGEPLVASARIAYSERG